MGNHERDTCCDSETPAHSPGCPTLKSEKVMTDQEYLHLMQLTAISCVAQANTRKTAANTRSMLPQWRTAALDDVERAVDREMGERERADALTLELKAANERIKELDMDLYDARHSLHYCVPGRKQAEARVKELEAEFARFKELNTQLTHDFNVVNRDNGKLRSELHEGHAPCHGPEECEASGLREEIARLNDILWGARCVYCGEVVGKDKQNQELADEVLRNHVLTCPKHPLSTTTAAFEAHKRNVQRALDILKDASVPHEHEPIQTADGWHKCATCGVGLPGSDM